MAVFLVQDLVVPTGDVRTYVQNEDGGIAAAIAFGPGAPDDHQPSLINRGTLQFQADQSTGNETFFYYFTNSFWDHARIENYGTINASVPNSNFIRVFYEQSWGPDLYNAGTITAQARTEAIGYFTADLDPTVTNLAGASISVTAQQNAGAIAFYNGGTVINNGLISASATGGNFLVRGATAISAGSDLLVVNSGTIEAKDNSTNPYAYAINFYGGANHTNIIVNSGTIHGDYALHEDNPNHYAATAIIRNTGLIQGIIDLADGTDEVHNGGQIVGDVFLGADNDLYDGQLGTITGTVFGGDGNDLLIGGAGHDSLNGGAGDDALFGGGGDTLTGGEGADIFVFTKASSQVETITDFVSGTDRIDLRGLAPTAVTIAGSTITATTSSGTLTIKVTGTVNLADIITSAPASANGTAGSDTLVAGPAGSTLSGGDGVDLLVGGPGNDRLAGGGGDNLGAFGNVMWGGTGDDTYVISNHLDFVIENANSGYDTIEVVPGALDPVYDTRLPMPDNVERLIGWGGIGNALDNVMIGSSLGDQFDGGAGNDTIDGGAGNDTITGGVGFDILTGGSGHDTFTDSAAGLNGDTITDFAGGDRIVITGASFTDFTFSLSGNTLSYTGGSLTFGSLLKGTLLASAMPGNAVQIVLLPAVTHAGDFNGDGISDVLWRSDSGIVTDWLGSHSGAFDGNFSNSNDAVSLDWKIAGIGDFNGDGRSDILWRNDAGVLTDWLGQANGGFVGNLENAGASVPSGWQLEATGDFNGDGRDDILWRNDAGTITDWLGTTDGGFAGNLENAGATLPLTWHIAATGDFNGDGRVDILWRDDSGTVTDWLGTATGGFAGNWENSASSLTNEWQVIATGDFNGDGRADVLWCSTSGMMTDWLGTADGGFIGNWAGFAVNVPAGGQIQSIGDFNDDGRDDILWRDQNGSGAVTEWFGTTTGGFTDNSTNSATWPGVAWHSQPEPAAFAL